MPNVGRLVGLRVHKHFWSGVEGEGCALGVAVATIQDDDGAAELDDTGAPEISAVGSMLASTGDDEGDNDTVTTSVGDGVGVDVGSLVHCILIEGVDEGEDDDNDAVEV